MSTQQYEFDVELIERELVNVSLDVLDIAPAVHLGDIIDVDLTNVLDGQFLKYDASTGKWKNVTLDIIIQEHSVFSESPTKLSSTQFQTANAYLPGTLRVFLNGIKEKYVTENSGNTFSFDLAVKPDDVIEINYIKDV
jgi:hypothetical protein